MCKEAFKEAQTPVPLGATYGYLLKTTDWTQQTNRRFFGLYYEEQSGDYSFKSTFPPLWMERRQGEDRASLFGLTYFNRRSPSYDADVLFPVFWHIRDEESYTTVVGPVMHNERPEGHDNWVAPLFFEGARENQVDHGRVRIVRQHGLGVLLEALGVALEVEQCGLRAA